MRKRIIILLISLAIIVPINNAISKYNLKKEEVETIKIARPVIEVIEGNRININNENLSDTYEFSVRNYKELNINEAELIYKIELKVNTANIESIRLVKIINGNEENQNLISNRTEGSILKATDKQEDKYKLYIAYKNKQYESNIEENLKIKINTIQNILEEGV